MSYILDALKKSEIERKQGDVPGLQTEQVFHGDREKKKPWWKYAFVIVVGINIGLVVDWYYTERQEKIVVSQQDKIIPQEAVLVSTKVADKDVVSRKVVATNIIARTEVEKNVVNNKVVNNKIAELPVKEGASESKSSEPMQVSPAMIEDQGGNKSAQKPVQDNVEQVAQTKTKKDIIIESNMESQEDSIALISKKSMETSEKNKEESKSSSKIRKTPPVIAKTQPIIEHDPRTILRISQLPDSVQRVLPDLTYSGHLYSSNPARRKLVINGRSMNEGEWVTDNLQLDEITIDGAIFSYKEYYYQIELLRNWSVN